MEVKFYNHVPLLKVVIKTHRQGVTLKNCFGHQLGSFLLEIFLFLQTFLFFIF